ncbi:hypothetical protein MLD38_034779 [Melastoma candidum]|uniref:Uncharacterized protein n=1 Tax=Melastoma candidum TaxID=119954 RepID=A0ACB9MEW3_9MYRT|nr:hypothetical protein MLD38_034779 [Melastoma candidum]
MSLGKRTRHPMRRTTSMSGITFDLNMGDETWPSDLQDDSDCSPLYGGGLLGGQDQRSVAMAAAMSPRALHQRHSSEFSDAAHFLRTCCLCKRRLFPGRDIYMYRGDSAFCSLECRQQQMNLDERKEKV